MKTITFWIGTLIILAVMAGQVFKKEQVLASGQTVLLRLAPRDPRSLMQGDYMVLRYEMVREIGDSRMRSAASDGRLVIQLDDKDVASFVRFNDGTPLNRRQVRLNFKMRGHFVSLGARSFFFQEGQAKRYSQARFGELKVDATGQSVLVGLRDGHLNKL